MVAELENTEVDIVEESLSALADAATGETRRAERNPSAADPFSGLPLRRQYESASMGDPFLSEHFRDARTRDAATGMRMRGNIQILRNRCRLEYDNNGYAKGIAETHADDIVGPHGPCLQVLDENSSEIESNWRAYCERLDITAQNGLCDFVRMIDLALTHTGSLLFVLTSDDEATGKDIEKLRLQAVEADRLKTPWKFINDKNVRDGIEYDKKGRPKFYYILKNHPGETLGFATFSGNTEDFDKVPAKYVLHIYRSDRPGQTTNVPRLSAALYPLAYLRDYTMSVLKAARRVASISGTLETTSTELMQKLDDDGKLSAADQQKYYEIEDDSLMVAPPGYGFKQTKAEQPCSTYAEFKNEILKEIGRPFCMTFNVVTGDSSKHSYSGGRLDTEAYQWHIRCIRQWLERVFLTPLFKAWINEAAFLPWYKKIWNRLTNNYPTISWIWQRRPHVDPLKEASAQTLELANNTTTLADIFAEKGEDWQEKMIQRGREFQFIAQLEKKFGVKINTADIVGDNTKLASDLLKMNTENEASKNADKNK